MFSLKRGSIAQHCHCKTSRSFALESLSIRILEWEEEALLDSLYFMKKHSEVAILETGLEISVKC